MIKPKILILAAAIALTGPAFAVVVSPPPNDNFANAIALSAGSSSVNGTSATAQPGEPDHFTYGGALHATHSVWWKFTPTINGYVQVDTRGSGYDTVLSVYVGTTLTTLKRIAQDDDSGNATPPKTSLVKIAVVKGVTYRIAVDGLSGDVTGPTTVNLTYLRINQPRTYQTAVFGALYKEDNGMLSFATTTSSVVTGKLRLGAASYSFTGAVDMDGHMLASIDRPGLLPVLLDVTVGSNFQGTVFGPAVGSLKIGDNVNSITANPVAVFTTVNPCPRWGRYVQAIQNTGAVGFGVTSFIVAKTGVVTATGTLADGTAFVYTASVLDDSGTDTGIIGNGGSFCYHLPMYLNQGQITGSSTFDAGNSPTSLGGTLQWFRPAPAANVAFLPQGINGSEVDTFGNRYEPPGPTHRVDPVFDNAPVGSSGHAVLQTGDDLDYPPFTKSDLFLSTSNVFSYGSSNPNLVKLAVSTDTGVISGTMKLATNAAKLSTVKGVIINYPMYTVQFYGFATSTTGTTTLVVHP